MSQPIKLGIIGAGIAVKRLHWPALQRLREQYTFVAVADIDPARAEEIAALVGAPHALTNYHDLLAMSEIEAVLVSLPIHLTAPVTLDAAQAGKHVLLEKPPAANLEQAYDLQKRLACLPVTAMVGENFRYRPDLLKIQQLVEAGEIGDVILLRLHALMKADTSNPNDFSSTPWRHDVQYRGGQVLDGGVHHAAALRGIGGDVEWVQAFAKYGGSELGGHTTISMNLRFRSGALGSYVYSAICHDEPSSFLKFAVYGTTGTLALHDDGSLRLLRPGKPQETIALDSEIPNDGGYYGEFLNFYEAVRERKPVVATLDQSIKDMELILRGIDSAEESRVILL